MTPLPLVSATQIELFDEKGSGGCERRWGFKYIEKLETPTHPAAALGTEVQDTQIDPYLGQGRAFDFSRPSGEIANKLVSLLPPPMSPGLRLRRKFFMPSPTGLFAYQGEFDLWALHASIVPGLESSTLQLLGDIKTTSNLNYAKSAKDLETDIQAQIYAMDVMFEETVDDLDLVWFYSRTKKAYRAQRTHLRVAAPHVVEQFQRIDEIAGRLVAIKLARPKVEDLRPNPRMCEKYPPHGCPFRHRCNLSPAVQAAAVNHEATMEAKSNDFLTNLRKQVTPSAQAPVVPLAFAPGGAPPAVAVIEPGLPSWATAAVDPIVARRQAVYAGDPVPPAINPPESALPPAPPVGAAAPAAVAAAPAPRRGRTPGAGLSLPEAFDLAAKMREHGIKSLQFDGSQVCGIEIAP